MEHRFGDLIILLASGINQRRMYFDNHPKVRAMSREFVTALAPVMRDDPAGEFRFGVFNGKFIRDGHYLVGPSIAGRSLIEFAERLGCGGFVFRRTPKATDLVTLFRVGAETKNALDGGLTEAQALFASAGLDMIELTPRMSEDGKIAGAGDGGEVDSGPAEASAEPGPDEFMATDFAPLLQVYQAMYETVAGNALAINGDSRLDLDQARDQGRQLVAVSDKGALDVMQFMRYPDFDSYTIGHSVRVAALSALLARELGWSPDLQAEMATAGLLHDLGKGKVPDEILFKPGKLDDDERRVMETHPVLGTRVLLANGETSPIVLAATWGHHIRHDGGGYPDMPSWFTASSAADLVHVCDVFEALTSARPYKDPMPPRQAYEVMLADAGAYDPRMLTTLVRTMGLYPPGSEVRLSDHRKAVVVARGATLENPRVRVTHDADGVPLARDDQPALHLQDVPELEVAGFVRVGIDSPDDDQVAGEAPTETVIETA